MTVHFHFEKKILLYQRIKIKQLLNYLVVSEKANITSLNYIFCSDAFLLRINQEYLGHTDLTDIITFDLGDVKNGVVGEIYISVDRVTDNALVFGVPIGDELLRVILHGLLHLCGYGDNSPKQRKLMRNREEFYLNHFRDVSRGT